MNEKQIRAKSIRIYERFLELKFRNVKPKPQVIDTVPGQRRPLQPLNSKCWCGSGRKYKKCCYVKEAE